MTREALKIVSGAVEERDANRLTQLAQAADRSVSAELRRAVREYLAGRDEQQMPEAHLEREAQQR